MKNKPSLVDLCNELWETYANGEDTSDVIERIGEWLE